MIKDSSLIEYYRHVHKRHVTDTTTQRETQTETKPPCGALEADSLPSVSALTCMVKTDNNSLSRIHQSLTETGFMSLMPISTFEHNKKKSDNNISTDIDDSFAF